MKRLTTVQIRNLKKTSTTPLVAVTAYDYTTAKLVDELVDIVLVGDSLGMTMQGQTDTLSVTMDQMVYHTRCVSQGIQKAHLVADLPFMSYQTSESEAIRNAGRLLSEGHAQAVKLEGGTVFASTVEKMVSCGIPVLGHVGLTPQSVHAFGGFKVQGKSPSSKESILADALALEDAGCYAIVLESIPKDLAQEITSRITVPTIGIGAGPFCDGQILVIQDLLGLNQDMRPKFVKSYADLAGETKKAVLEYAKEVRSRQFPLDQHSFHADS